MNLGRGRGRELMARMRMLVSRSPFSSPESEKERFCFVFHSTLVDDDDGGGGGDSDEAMTAAVV